MRMSKPKKKATKQIKQEKKQKQTKVLGLAKFLQKPKKSKVSKPGEAKNVEADKKTKKKTFICNPNQKDLSLVNRCKLQMSSSLLRLIDEDLYKTDSKEISIDKDKFLAYHEAYASVSQKWPIQPIDHIVKFIKRRFLGKRPIHKFQFADIGCGPESLLKKKLPHGARVLSFDLVASHKDVTEANMDSLPVPDESVNCAVYSLSLMAINLGKIILEGKRILKLGGSLLIVEVTSRFDGNEKKFTSKLERLGLKHKSTTPLKPNGFFTFFQFIKINSNTDYSSSQLNIQLKSCVYKTR